MSVNRLSGFACPAISKCHAGEGFPRIGTALPELSRWVCLSPSPPSADTPVRPSPRPKSRSLKFPAAVGPLSEIGDLYDLVTVAHSKEIMEQGIDRLRAALAPYTTTAAPRPADKALVVKRSVMRRRSHARCEACGPKRSAKLADVINDIRRDVALGLEGGEEEHAKLMRRLGSRGWSLSIQSCMPRARQNSSFGQVQIVTAPEASSGAAIAIGRPAAFPTPHRSDTPLKPSAIDSCCAAEAPRRFANRSKALSLTVKSTWLVAPTRSRRHVDIPSLSISPKLLGLLAGPD